MTSSTATPSSVAYAADCWDRDILPALADYIRIPALSPAFDADWASHGHIADAVRALRSWAEARAIDGATIDVVELSGRTPVLLIDVPPKAASTGSSADAPSAVDTVLLYGHLDKQPEMSGWRDGLGPWTPVREGEHLFGRGGADDGYAMFAALAAIEAVRAGGRPHARCVVLIEASEESGSPDLPAYVEALTPRLGSVSLVVCLDSGCGDYERLWVTTSLRGLVAGTLAVQVSHEGLHSGGVGGVIPSASRILRQLLDRVEDSADGRVLLEGTDVAIPDERLAQVRRTAAVLGDVTAGYPVVEGLDVRGGRSPEEVLLDRTWRPALELIGVEGLPPIAEAGNVLRPRVGLALSLRTPPSADPAAVSRELTDTLTADPPRRAHVRFDLHAAAPGWDAPPSRPWLADALSAASTGVFGADVAHQGEGGTIPFMGMLGEQFPDAQFAVIGLLGPGANAHGPNESLHVPTGKRLTACVAELLAAHAVR